MYEEPPAAMMSMMAKPFLRLVGSSLARSVCPRLETSLNKVLVQVARPGPRNRDQGRFFSCRKEAAHSNTWNHLCCQLLLDWAAPITTDPDVGPGPGFETGRRDRDCV